MSDYEVGGAPKPIGSMGLTAPDGRVEYNILPLTRGPMLILDKFRNFDFEGAGFEDQLDATFEAIAGLLEPQNGGPPARETLDKMWKAEYLDAPQVADLAEFLTTKASGDNPPA